MRPGKTAARAGLGATLVLLSLGAASAQLLDAAFLQARPHHGLLRSIAGWHSEALDDLDHVFAALAAPPPSPVELHERIDTDANGTAHLYLSVRQRHCCAEPSAVELSAVNVSVLEDELTVRASTAYGALTCKYTLPEHALPDQVTAEYTADKFLHVACPTDAPPPPQPRRVEVSIERAESSPDSAAGQAAGQTAPPPTAAHSGDNEWTAYGQGAHPAPRSQHAAPAPQAPTPVAQAANASAAAEDSEPHTSSSEPRPDLQRHIKKLEADLAYLKSMM